MKIRRYHFVAAAIFPTVLLLTFNGLYLGPAYRVSHALFWALDFMQFVLVPGLSLWLLARLGSVSPFQYGLGRPRTRDDWFGLLGLCIFISIACCYTYFAGSYLGLMVDGLWKQQSFSYMQAVSALPSAAPLLIGYLALTAGVVEEVMYRGLPYLFFSARLSEEKLPLVYVLSSSVLFAAGHWENGSREMLASFLVGLVMAALYMKIRKLWPFVAGHMFTDILAFNGYL